MSSVLAPGVAVGGDEGDDQIADVGVDDVQLSMRPTSPAAASRTRRRHVPCELRRDRSTPAATT
jgi:hypothetical protein